MIKGSIIILCATALCAVAAAAIAVSRTPRNVDVADVSFGDFTKTVEVTGKVTPSKVYSVVAQNGGRVSAVAVKEGQVVRTGELLYEIERADIERSLVKAKKELESAKATLRAAAEQPQGQAQSVLSMEDESLESAANRSNDAIRKAQNEGIDYQTFNEAVEAAYEASAEQVSASAEKNADTVEAANMQVKTASNRIHELETILKSLTACSEADGTVIDMQIAQGEVLEKGQTVLSIADMNKLNIVANVELEDLRKVKVGQRAQIWQNERAWKGTVVRVSPTVRLHSEEMMGEIEIQPDEGFNELIGENLEVSIVTEQARDVCMVPVDCVAKDENGCYVFAVDDDRLVKRSVIVGMQDDFNIVIEDGLQIGEQAALFPEEYERYRGRIRAIS